MSNTLTIIDVITIIDAYDPYFLISILISMPR